MSKGIVLRAEDELITSRAHKAGLEVIVSDGYDVHFDKTLFVDAGTRVPFDLLPAAFHFLERWDAAVPLWTYGELAEGQGTADERKATRAIVGDLRVMMHAVELVFVRRNDAGQELMQVWKEEQGGDRRLAFLRAVHRVKPRLCVLPITWLADVRQASHQALTRRARPVNAGKPLVKVELEPDHFVKCHEGDEETVRAHFERQRATRGGNNGMAVVTARDTWTVTNQKKNAQKGPLIKVDMGNGQYVKKYKADAIAEGLIEPDPEGSAPETKSRPKPKDKQRKPQEDKSVPAPEEEKQTTQEVDDFTVIDGVGPATARALVANGVTTLDELREAGELDYLSAAVNASIEEWRNDG